MLRVKWEFEYTASKLASAAKEQHDFRVGRIKVWEEKKQQVMQQIRDTGLSIDESLALQLSNKMSSYTSHNSGVSVKIDQTLLDNLDETVQKINEHTTLKTQYNAWTQVLFANPESRLKLDHEDWMFFFGR
jgi:hypothetical protein